jgi:hypothetical protein
MRREGLWENPPTGHAEAAPRHAEIANLLARRICRKLSIPDPPGQVSAKGGKMAGTVRIRGPNPTSWAFGGGKGISQQKTGAAPIDPGNPPWRLPPTLGSVRVARDTPGDPLFKSTVSAASCHNVGS